MPTWIDFKELRARLDFEQLLRHYGVEVKRKGEQHHGFCPLPGHKGKRNSPSFSANIERRIFHCFGCGAKGNILEFAALMENADPSDGEALRRVAVKLHQQFLPEHENSRAGKKKATEKAQTPKSEDLPVIVNPPLDFELRGLDREHPYLKQRGFAKETIGHFNLGYCSRGSLKERVAIPLHDHQGRLVGYAGRVVNDAAIGEDNPRYRFPSKRMRDGNLIEFRKTLFLYNGFQIKAPVEDLIVVEGFASVWWLYQNRLAYVVAVMGAECSEAQAELIVSLVKPTGRVWVMPDGNAAGQRCAQALLSQVSPHRFIRWVKLEPEIQPTDLSAGQLKNCFKM